MQLQHDIGKARKMIASLNGQQGRRLRDICMAINEAQKRLNREAAPFFKRCIQHCNGICCKNIHVSDIVNFLDFIYILTLVPDIYAPLHEAASKERLFTADCLFLHNGQGPCMFPSTVKPERCILTFCEDTTPIRHEIKSVRANFSRLSRYTKLKRPFFWIGF